LTALPPYRGRFAPSPTGPLHQGSLVAAVASWLDARAAGGEWRLRIEDVDAPRCVPGADEDIRRVLESLGLEWDGPVEWQDRRRARYEEALRALRARGLVYRCRCSRREIADSALRGIEGVVYPGTCRDRRLGDHVDGADRFRVGGEPIDFEDRLRGRLTQDLARDIGDFVVRRRDGLHAYQLAVVVDDADDGITDVVRGADLLWSTPRQVALQRALGLPTPRYLHVPVVTNDQGEKLSKQTLAAPVRAGDAAALREALRFLRQPAELAGSPREILDAAAKSWDATAMRGTI
jgi:glutamyl-Q tRNA(Asp) synthetase